MPSVNSWAIYGRIGTASAEEADQAGKPVQAGLLMTIKYGVHLEFLKGHFSKSYRKVGEGQMGVGARGGYAP